jgi:8-oxo-dGTP pyrophosphatase MutT (NUDIX family)
VTGRLRRGYRGPVTPPPLRTFVVGVSVYALDPHERILLLRRAKAADFEPGHWEPVSGRVEPGEDIRGTAVRELFEETRLEATKIIPFETFSFERRPGYVLHGVAMLARVGSDVVVLSSEHSEYRWVPSAGPLPGITLALGVGETLGYLRAHLPLLAALL